jgi:hypothetical protein
MKMAYCQNCGKNTGHKRVLGLGTFFAVILTGGLWLLAIPGYPERCCVCGVSKEEVLEHQELDYTPSSLERKSLWAFVIVGTCIVVFFLYESLR